MTMSDEAKQKLEWREGRASTPDAPSICADTDYGRLLVGWDMYSAGWTGGWHGGEQRHFGDMDDAKRYCELLFDAENRKYEEQ